MFSLFLAVMDIQGLSVQTLIQLNKVCMEPPITQYTHYIAAMANIAYDLRGRSMTADVAVHHLLDGVIRSQPFSQKTTVKGR